MSLILDKINYVYSEGTAYQIQALKDVNLEIRDGQFIGVIGHTGSGKSTLIQHLNGLVKATSGTIYFNGQDIYDEDFDLRELRNRVGLVFQYPEHQLFETTIFDDVCFGPKNQGLSKEEAGRLAQRQAKFISHLEAALVRIENKTYGICRVTGKLISKERLRAVPHATLSMEAKEGQES